jgi:hypothetical protein
MHLPRKGKWAVAEVQVKMLSQDSAFDGVPSGSYIYFWVVRKRLMDVSGVLDMISQLEAWV